MSSERKSRWLFKITIVGPDDMLLREVMDAINSNTVAVDGIRIGSRDLEAGSSEVRAVMMSPTKRAMDILFSFSYRGASAVIIVLRRPDPEIETKYRNEIRENIGSGCPTRVFYVGDELNEEKRKELAGLFTSLIEEMIEARETSDK
ncbi:MAG: hypothetical protein DRO73_00655 [Candidatus Thorarchaeota archaeon]|nr:MAG: hypothetical protein DRO73_00655 [Candidatus Thorarchaeota archaeon]